MSGEVNIAKYIGVRKEMVLEIALHFNSNSHSPHIAPHKIFLTWSRGKYKVLTKNKFSKKLSCESPPAKLNQKSIGF
jgi:hypothetical protein